MTRLWCVLAIWVPILRKTLVEECIGEMRLIVRKGSLEGGVRATLGPDVTLDYGLVFAYCECSGHRIFQETLSGFIYTLMETIWGEWRYVLCATL